MNTRMAVSIGVLVLVAAGASIAAQYIHTSSGGTSLEVFEPTSHASGTPAGQGSGPSGATIVQGTPIQVVTHITLAFDAPTFRATTPYPTLTGSASNVTSAQIVINDSNGTGLERANVAIQGGRWSYSSARALTPGTYTAFLGVQGLVVKATLVVK